MAIRNFFVPFAASAALLTSAPSFAQTGGWQLPGETARFGYSTEAPQYGYSELRRAAYDRGYRDGFRSGEEDGRRGDRYYFEDERDYRDADNGYNRTFGDRDRYRQIFRDGFAAGYREGYSRRSYGGNNRGPGWYGQRGPSYGQGGYGGYGGGYYSPALNNGLRDGHEKGVEDARKNRSFDPRRHSWYRSGDRHYERRYGPREQYEDTYRRGFQEGYERGYREGRYRY
jgi:flagellar biosynthesis/type III secretory pathway protein FliH